MAHTVQSKAEQTKHNFHHLKPLSIYSRMTCNQETSVCHPKNFSKQFTNFKVELMNNCALKRELENSSCDDGYETPSKKFFFDCDVEDILSLNATDANAAVDVSGNVRSCQNPFGSTFQNKPGQKQARGAVQKERQKELKENQNVKDDLEDKGYFSLSYTKLPTATSSPLPRACEDVALQHKCQPESSSEQAIFGQQVSITDFNLHFNICIPLLDSVNTPVKSLGTDFEDISNIAAPLFESSVCVTLNAGSEHTRELLSEELQGDGIHLVPESQTTHEEEATVDTSYEDTLPLNIQYTANSTPDFPPAKPNLEEKECKRCASRPRTQRPATFNSELEWEHKKRQYIHLVTRHVNNKGEAQDVVTELLNLMTHVADQTPVSGMQWQHPSDLTRRNHQRRFHNETAKMSLQEWQAKNCTARKRFAKVPRIFERSKLP